MANKYVRAGADGANDGSDWTNAFTALPSTLVRGDTYYIADGEYPSYTFDDAVSGSDVITIKKATQAAHGTDTGWDGSYGDGYAQFNPISITSSYYTFDGATGGGPGSWKSGHGFRIYGAAAGDERLIYLTSVSDIVFERIEIGNAEQQPTGQDTGIYAIATPTRVAFRRCWMHNTANEGFIVANPTEWLIEYCAFDNLDVNSVANHGIGFYVSGTVTNFTLRWSLLGDISDGTGWFGLYSGSVNGLYIYGNVFYSTNSSAQTWGNGVICSTASYAGPMVDFLIYQNTFYNISDPSLVYLPNTHGSNVGCEFKNNIVYGTSGTPSYTWPSFTKSHNASDAAISGDSNLQLLTVDPIWNAADLDFRLGYNTISGINLGVDYDEDYLGNERTTWSRGALEYVSPITPPTNFIAAQNGSSSISLSWTDASSDEDGFIIERSLNGSTGWTEIADLAAGSTSYTDTGLSSGTTYYYRVAAYDEYGSSAWSDVASAATEAAPVLTAGVTSGSSFVSFF